MSTNNGDQLQQVVQGIEELLAQGMDIVSITVRVMEESGYSTRKVMENLGGLNLIKKNFFPNVEKDLASTYKLKSQASYVSKLETKLGQTTAQQQDLLAIVKAQLKPLPKPKAAYKYKDGKKKIKRELVMMLNDTHYGLCVDSESVNNINTYSWKEASRRTAMVVKEAIEYKPYARHETETLHLVLNGDLMAGVIHGITGKGQDLLIHQYNGMVHILTHTIHNLASNFKNVKVYGMNGNHSELSHKREHGNRVASEFYDSYDNMAFYALSVGFRNYSNVEFIVPKTPYVFLDLPGGRAMAAHGHNMFSKALGNPGSNVNIKSLTNEIRTFNSGEQLKGQLPIKLVLFGHTHSYVHFITKDGVDVLNAPSLSGTDEYAHQLNINNNFIGQVIFESTKDFVVGDKRLVRLNEADKNPELDKIIPVYKYGLKWQK